jgi:hypothetical protein
MNKTEEEGHVRLLRRGKRVEVGSWGGSKEGNAFLGEG